jgi:hypothetical protein
MNLQNQITQPTLEALAIHGFYRGNDYFGETVVGIGNKHYEERDERYVVSVQLIQPDGHKCSSGIGFYVQPDNKLQVFSSGEVLLVPITETLEKELEQLRNIALGDS